MATRVAPDQWSMTVTPVFAAITVLCAATALSGVIDGSIWLGYAGIAVMVVTATGMGLRAVRVPILLVGLAQLFALTCLVVALFADDGVLGVLPGPKAIEQIGNVLRGSVSVVQTGVPPVEATTPILCLVVIAIGLVAVLVDSLAVAAGTPAASGLVLLCVYAVPASLADEMLPWWSFILGAASYAMLLAIDGTHRHQQWRNRPARPGTSGARTLGTPTVIVSLSLLLAIAFGSAFTLIGTVGQLPGDTSGGGAGSGGFAINPFTNLRGMLDQKGNQEMYRVRGLNEDHRYLRATTLKRYQPNVGWGIGGGMPNGIPVNQELPLDPGRSVQGEPVRVEIEPVSADDYWAPVYGAPRRVEGVPSDVRYDEGSGSVYSRRQRKLARYVEIADMTQPTYEQLRAAPPVGAGDISSEYLELPPLDSQVKQLAERLTAGRGSQWDKVLALKNYFSPDNGFIYRTQTAAQSDEDALVDFLFNGKTGYCEQYASSMAVLVRAAGIPARVAIGYTSGFQMTDYRSITTQDAHAWVEVYFKQHGWITIDPTPLSDGRAYIPPYMTPQTSAQGNLPDGGETTSSTPTEASTTTAPATQGETPGQTPDQAAPQDEAGSWLTWTIVSTAGAALLATLAVVFTRRRPGGGRKVGWLALGAGLLWLVTAILLVGLLSWWLAIPLGLLVSAAYPALLRVWRRRNRLHVVATNAGSSADAAWQELLAESWDRGATIPDTDTVRMAARRLVREHSLDDEGKQGLRTVVGVLERSWYGGTDGPDPALPKAVEDVRQSMRRNAPLALRARLLPRSVLRPRRRSNSGKE